MHYRAERSCQHWQSILGQQYLWLEPGQLSLIQLAFVKPHYGVTKLCRAFRRVGSVKSVDPGAEVSMPPTFPLQPAEATSALLFLHHAGL